MSMPTYDFTLQIIIASEVKNPTDIFLAKHRVFKLPQNWFHPVGRKPRGYLATAPPRHV
jgi:hypothetical protein